MTIERLQVGLLGTNCYIIETEKSVVVVDPGGSAHDIITEVKRIGKPVSSLLLTHGHFDHILAIGALCHTFGDIPVYVHKNDEAKVSEKEVRSFLSAAAPSLLQELGDDLAFPSCFEALEDGSVVSDAELKVLHTPGHSGGSVCFYNEKAGILFSGDTLFKGTVGRTDLPDGSTETLLRSIHEQLLPLDEETAVYPGHGEASTLSQEKLYNPFLN